MTLETPFDDISVRDCRAHLTTLLGLFVDSGARGRMDVTIQGLPKVVRLDDLPLVAEGLLHRGRKYDLVQRGIAIRNGDAHISYDVSQWGKRGSK